MSSEGLVDRVAAQVSSRLKPYFQVDSYYESSAFTRRYFHGALTSSISTANLPDGQEVFYLRGIMQIAIIQT